jgi:hypothetical protein
MGTTSTIVLWLIVLAAWLAALKAFALLHQSPQ